MSFQESLDYSVHAIHDSASRAYDDWARQICDLNQAHVFRYGSAGLHITFMFAPVRLIKFGYSAKRDFNGFQVCS